MATKNVGSVAIVLMIHFWLFENDLWSNYRLIRMESISVGLPA